MGISVIASYKRRRSFLWVNSDKYQFRMQYPSPIESILSDITQLYQYLRAKHNYNHAMHKKLWNLPNNKKEITANMMQPTYFFLKGNQNETEHNERKEQPNEGVHWTLHGSLRSLIAALVTMGSVWWICCVRTDWTELSCILKYQCEGMFRRFQKDPDTGE